MGRHATSPITALPQTIQIPTVRKKLLFPLNHFGDSAAVHHSWYSGDPQGGRVLERRIQTGDEVWGRKVVPDSEGRPPENLQDNLIKRLVEGDFYDVRENGMSEPFVSFGKSGRPPAEIDSSDFQQGIPSNMNPRQALRFFKKQDFDPKTNCSLMNQLMAHRFMDSNKRSDMPKCPNIISRNISQVRNGACRPGLQRFASFNIRNSVEDPMNAAQGFVSKSSQREVSKWLQRASIQEKDAFRKLFASIGRVTKASRSTGNLNSSAMETYSAEGNHSNNSKDSTSLSVDVSLGPSLAMSANAKLMDQDSPNKSTETNKKYKVNFDGTLLHGGRAEECLADQSLIHLKNTLQEHIQMKSKNLRNAWRWIDPNCTGFIDVNGFQSLLSEFDIPYDRATALALYDVLDVNGDGILGFDDFCKSLNDLALEERDFFAVSKRAGAMLANEPVIFEHLGIGKAAQHVENSYVPQPQLSNNELDSFTMHSEGHGLSANANDITAPPRTAAVARRLHSSGKLSEPNIPDCETGAGPKPMTSNFRSDSPKPLRSAAFMPPRFPMRKPVAAANRRLPATSMSPEPATYDVLILDDPISTRRAGGRPPLKTTSTSVPLPRDPDQDIGPASRTQRAAAGLPGDAGRSVSVDLPREKPAEIFFMRPRTSMSVHKQTVLPERRSGTWD